jgi:threonine dehydrogenase-like Zn-dependent dehydrogenase
MRRFLPELIDLGCNREIEPGKVFDLTLPLDQAAEGYRAMDERRTHQRPYCGHRLQTG